MPAGELGPIGIIPDESRKPYITGVLKDISINSPDSLAGNVASLILRKADGGKHKVSEYNRQTDYLIGLLLRKKLASREAEIATVKRILARP